MILTSHPAYDTTVLTSPRKPAIPAYLAQKCIYYKE